MAKGVFRATKKDGSVYYRASITYRGKHISLGSFAEETDAHQAYQTADALLQSETSYTPEDYHSSDFPCLLFPKWISLINFKNNGLYIKTPIYLQRHFFSYYLSPQDVLVFDVDDLFYYSNHAIMRRGNHLFVSEYGMQTNIHTRYGIRNFARPGVDFTFTNGNSNDYRYSNIRIINPYHGVTVSHVPGHMDYAARLHIRGNYLVGHFVTLQEAAVAYNKAADHVEAKGCPKQFARNYIENMTKKEYASLYDSIQLPNSLLTYSPE